MGQAAASCCRGGWSVISAQRKRDELAGDRDVDDGRALAALGQVVVAVVQADLGVPGARRTGSRAAGSGRRGAVAVVPGGLDQQPAGVAVAGLGDVAAVLLIAGGVLARRDPQPGRQFARVREAARSRRSLRSAPAPSGSRCRESASAARPGSRQRSLRGDLLQLGVERASWRSSPSRWISICSSASCASASSRRCACTQRAVRLGPGASCPRGRSARGGAAAWRRGGAPRSARNADRRGSASGPAAPRSRSSGGCTKHQLAGAVAAARASWRRADRS